MVQNVLKINREKTIFWSLVGILFISFCFYMYCVRSTIHNVVARQDLETEVSTLTLSIGSKEFQYITKRNAINLDTAYALGFKDANAKTYISKDSDTEVAVLNR